MDEMPGRFPPPPETGPPGPGGPPPAGPPGMPPYGQGYPPGPRSFFPLDLGRLMDATLSLFRFRWRTFVVIALLVTAPIAIAPAILSALVYDPNVGLELSELAARGAMSQFLDRLWESVLVNAGVNLLLSAMMALAGLVTAGAVVHVTATTFAGRRMDTMTAIRRSLARLPTFVGVYLLTLLLTIAVVFAGVFLGAVLFFATASDGQVVPGPLVFAGLVVIVATMALLVFVTVRFAFMVQAAVVDSLGAVAALRRSWNLVSGSGWRVFGYVLLFGLLVGLFTALVSVVISLALAPVRVVTLTTFEVDPLRFAIATYLSMVLGAALAPISTVALTLLYFDLRARRGEEVPQPGAAASASAPPPGP